ncbi:MAG: glycoside hydrolase family 99-like domain-containing protein [Planctomycetaceae bacterium]|nr:glycoside hydrolase family 99-like domain-containing protein [Planctomycetaceae bacterium]
MKLYKILIVIISMVFISNTFAQNNDNNKSVYAHFVTWFKTKDVSGRWEMWNSDYNESPHNPDTIFMNGRRDLAVTSYPLTGPYDTSDPDILEYQFLLMRLSGIDGIIVDWDGRKINQYRHDALMTILPYLEKYNLKLIMCFEEWCGYWPRGTFADRQAEIKAAKDEMQWMIGTFLDKPFYGTINGKKPVLVFRKIPDKWFNPAEWQDITKDFNNVRLIFDADAYRQFGSAVGGKYFWVGSFDPKTNNSSLEFCKKVYTDFFNIKNPQVKNGIIFGGVTPGFDDSPVWGWGTTARKAPRYDGKRFDMTWQMSIDNKVDVVQVITWNDWNEGTQIEPCDEFGYEYLELNKKYSAIYKGIKDDMPNDVLRIPLKLYKARKAGQAEKAVLDELSGCLFNKDFGKAKSLAGKIND